MTGRSASTASRRVAAAGPRGCSTGWPGWRGRRRRRRSWCGSTSPATSTTASTAHVVARRLHHEGGVRGRRGGTTTSTAGARRRGPEPPCPTVREEPLDQRDALGGASRSARARGARGPSRSGRRGTTEGRASCRSWRCPAATPCFVDALLQPPPPRRAGAEDAEGGAPGGPATSTWVAAGAVARRRAAASRSNDLRLVRRPIAVLGEQRRPRRWPAGRAHSRSHTGPVSYAPAMADATSSTASIPARRCDLAAIDPADTSAAPGDKTATREATEPLVARLAELQEILWAAPATSGPRRAAGHRHVRQGRHGRARPRRGEPCGPPGHLLQGAHRGRAGPRLPVAGPRQRAGHRRDRRVRPQPLRGRPRGAGARPGARGAVAPALRPHQRRSSSCSPTRAPRSSRCSSTSPRTSRSTGSRHGSTSPTKHWKFQRVDLDARAAWDDYQAAFEEAIEQHRHRARAVVRHPRRQEVVPELGGRHDPGRRPRGHGPHVAGARDDLAGIVIE